VVAASWGHVAAIALMFVAMRFALKAVVGLSTWAYLRTLLRPAAFALAMAAIVLGTSAALTGVVSSNGWLLVIEVATGAITYAALLAFLERDYLRSTWELLRRQPPSGRADVATAGDLAS
jgi:hypothetical protein